MIADIEFKVHLVRKNQLKIPVYRPEALLLREMNRTRKGDFLLGMGFTKADKRKFRQNNDIFEAYKIGRTRD